MPKLAHHALFWCSESQQYDARNTSHVGTLLQVFGDSLTLTPESQEWFEWLASISSTLIPEQITSVDIGEAPKGPPYDDTFWLPDRSHFPLVQPTKERCLIYPSARWLQRDPIGQAWCSHPTCWRRYNLMRLGALVNYHHTLGYDRDTFIAAGAESWAAYANEKDDAHVEFSLRQTIFYCMNLDLQLPDLSEDARLHSRVYDAWK